MLCKTDSPSILCLFSTLDVKVLQGVRKIFTFHFLKKHSVFFALCKRLEYPVGIGRGSPRTSLVVNEEFQKGTMLFSCLYCNCLLVLLLPPVGSFAANTLQPVLLCITFLLFMCIGFYFGVDGFFTFV